MQAGWEGANTRHEGWLRLFVAETNRCCQSPMHPRDTQGEETREKKKKKKKKKKGGDGQQHEDDAKKRSRLIPWTTGNQRDMFQRVCGAARRKKCDRPLAAEHGQ